MDISVITATIAILSSIVDARIWTIRITTEYSLGYFDDEGWLYGFSVDLVDIVCTEGNIDCRVVIGSSGDCWIGESDGAPGSGGHSLLSRRYDACLGQAATVQRIAVFSFSRSHGARPPVYFFTLKGKAKDYDPYDLKDKAIVFSTHSSSDDSCLRRNDDIKNTDLGDYQIILASNRAELTNALTSGKADAAFTTTTFWRNEELDIIEQVPGFSTFCVLGGSAISTRKDSAFLAEWNVAFSKLVNTNKYEKFCLESAKKHSTQVPDFSDRCFI